jgi:predicted Zn-dependent protease
MTQTAGCIPARAIAGDVLYPVALGWHSQAPDKTSDPKVLAVLTVEQAAGLLAHDPARAEEWARATLKSRPSDPRVLLILGSARRRQGDPEAAHRLLAPLARSHPKAAHTHYELGATFVALGKTAEAIAALGVATTINPDLQEAWRLLGEQLFREGETARAEAAFAEQLRASVQNPALKGAAKALSLGRVREAESELRAYLTARPDDREALQLIGEALIRLGRSAAAEVALRYCLELDASQDGARFVYASALLHQQKGDEALPHAEHLLEKKPDDPAYLNLLAASLGLIGEDERALEIYARLSAEYPKQPRIWLNYGQALRTVGKSQDAVAAYRSCIALAPGLGEAYWSLANLKVAAFTAGEEAVMLAQAGRSDLGEDDRLHLHYALGKAFEDSGNYAASFDQYREAAQMRRSQTPYDADETTAYTQRCKATFTSDFFAARQGAGCMSQAPIFIVGLPRSGSTLIEQILSSHSQVEGTRELPDIGFIAHELGWMSGNPDVSPYPQGVSALELEHMSILGRAFLDRTAIHRKRRRPYFIDKMPNNFQHIGLIRLILPEAKIIDARRHPLGACFSSFKQHFAQGQPFSYDLTDLGRYYRDYVELMHHFDAVMPGRIHRVIYEDLVDDTEAVVRCLLDYCGLPFEESCLKFYENARSVRTVSSEQVRRPIFRDGVEQWRRFEPWLDPLKAALGSALEDWR